ncbi:HAD family hydrolase [Nocardia jiangsuensis]|uniref:HAD family hydrolase n=1 Tax=Nocardia jiangsuensis TaxID=1691563 RepID=A0ABV8DU78_9NOCA
MSSALPALVATDLDRTMIYSRAASGDAEALACVEHLDGEPLSFMTERAAVRLRELAGVAVVLPTTTRTIEQYRRIALPGGPFRYAVTSNGGNLLVDGEPDGAWRAAAGRDAAAGGAGLAEVRAELLRRIDDSWVLKFREADELFCYLVVNVAAMPAGFLADWDGWCRAHGWSASQQGRKIYAMPVAVCKSVAVAEVRRRLLDDGVLRPEAPLFAAGDGALDAELLASADFAVRPRHGELEELGWSSPNLVLTESRGADAGAEMVEWFHTGVRASAATAAKRLAG